MLQNMGLQMRKTRKSLKIIIIIFQFQKAIYYFKFRKLKTILMEIVFKSSDNDNSTETDSPLKVTIIFSIFYIPIYKWEKGYTT